MPDHPLSDLPPVPVIPSTWTPTTVATLLSGVAVFVLGVLTSAGVVLPANVSTDVSTVTGAITAIAGAVTPLVALLSQHSVQKAAIARLNGLSVADIARL